jgi:hypothetical protein
LQLNFIRRVPISIHVSQEEKEAKNNNSQKETIFYGKIVVICNMQIPHLKIQKIFKGKFSIREQ